MAVSELLIDRQGICKQVIRLMGNRFEVSVVTEDANWANWCIEMAIEEIRRIEQLFTTFSNDSVTNQINQQAGIAPVKAPAEVMRLIERSIKISGITQGAFDITYGSVDKRFWNFDQQMTALPDPEKAKESVKLINYRNILLDWDQHTVFLTQPGMRIGFGGIGKGYAAERAKLVMQQAGVRDGIVNAAGDLTAWGYQPDRKPWAIGIVNPDDTSQVFARLNITGKAVATSGNYEKFVWIDGVKYSHTIDPRTGFPVRGIKSTTIISPDAEISDALTTPVMIMGIDAGLNLINQIQGIGCIIVDDYNRLHTSSNINLTT